MSQPTLSVSLLPYPGPLAAPVDTIVATCRLQADGGLALSYRLKGQLAALRIPEATRQVEPDRLWAHTCFEVFLARRGAGAYREYNFSPSGQWAGYAFADYRQREATQCLPAPVLNWQRGADILMLTGTLPAQALPVGNEPLTLGLAAVLELSDGRLAYWALHHPGSQPDFHHRDGFILTLNACP